MNNNPPTRRSLLRFSLRDLFWALTVVALVIGWSLDHWQLKNSLFESQSSADRRLKQLETAIYLYNWSGYRAPMSAKDGGVQINADGGAIEYLLPWE